MRKQRRLLWSLGLSALMGLMAGEARATSIADDGQHRRKCVHRGALQITGTSTDTALNINTANLNSLPLQHSRQRLPVLRQSRCEQQLRPGSTSRRGCVLDRYWHAVRGGQRHRLGPHRDRGRLRQASQRRPYSKGCRNRRPPTTPTRRREITNRSTGTWTGTPVTLTLGAPLMTSTGPVPQQVPRRCRPFRG